MNAFMEQASMAIQETNFKAVQSSWDHYLKERAISLDFTISSAIETAFTEWLDANKADVIAAIVASMTEQTDLGVMPRTTSKG
jgi:hypothetical protein